MPKKTTPRPIRRPQPEKDIDIQKQIGSSKVVNSIWEHLSKTKLTKIVLNDTVSRYFATSPSEIARSKDIENLMEFMIGLNQAEVYIAGEISKANAFYLLELKAPLDNWLKEQKSNGVNEFDAYLDNDTMREKKHAMQQMYCYIEALKEYQKALSRKSEDLKKIIDYKVRSRFSQ